MKPQISSAQAALFLFQRESGKPVGWMYPSFHASSKHTNKTTDSSTRTGQRAGHVFAALLVTVRIAFAQHKKNRRWQGRPQWPARKGDGICHAIHYREACMTRKRGNLRWWIATLCGVCGVLLGIALGLWQLDRAAQKKAVARSSAGTGSRRPCWMQACSASVLRTICEMVAMLERGCTVAFDFKDSGSLAYTVYLDNRQMQGRPGFYVLTPLQLDRWRRGLGAARLDCAQVSRSHRAAARHNTGW